MDVLMTGRYIQVAGREVLAVRARPFSRWQRDKPAAFRLGAHSPSLAFPAGVRR